MKKPILIVIMFVAIAAMISFMCASGCVQPSATNPPTTQQAIQAIALQGETFAVAANAVATARDLGLATQAEIDSAKPLVDAYLSARSAAETQARAGADVTTLNALAAQANAAWVKAAPFFLAIEARKATTQPSK